MVQTSQQNLLFSGEESKNESPGKRRKKQTPANHEMRLTFIALMTYLVASVKLQTRSYLYETVYIFITMKQTCVFHFKIVIWEKGTSRLQFMMIKSIERLENQICETQFAHQSSIFSLVNGSLMELSSARFDFGLKV